MTDSELRHTYTDDDFERFNTTSLQYLLHVYHDSETYTEDDKQIALDIVKRFLAWYKLNKPNQYMPSHGLEHMYSTESIDSLTVKVDNVPAKDLMKVLDFFDALCLV